MVLGLGKGACQEMDGGEPQEIQDGDLPIECLAQSMVDSNQEE